MDSRTSLLLSLLVFVFSIAPALCLRQLKDTGPELINLTKSDIELAYKYWNYNATTRIRRQGSEPRSNNYLGYDFLIPLPERLAGLSYVGHAARLRLLLERLRNGEAIRVGSVGGSITAGQGIGGAKRTYGRQFINWLNAAMPPTYLGKGQSQYPIAEVPEFEEVPEGGFGADGEGYGDNEEHESAERRRALSQDPRDWSEDRSAHPQDDDGEEEREVLPALASERQLAALREATQAAATGAAASSGAFVFPGLSGSSGSGSSGSSKGDGGSGGRRALRSSGSSAPLQHEYISGGMAGTMSSYMSSCLSHHVPPGVDLMFVEYACNDPPVSSWAFTDPTRRAYERLLRKLYRLPSQPALIIINMYAYRAAHGKYYHNAERDFNELAMYYGIPSLSLKAAIVPPTTAGDDGSGKVKSSVPELSLRAIYNGGKHHPGRGGHVVVVEELITLFLDLLQSNARLRGPSSRESWGWKEGAVDAEAGIEPAALKALKALAARPLPPPVADGNFEATKSMCYVEEELQAMVCSADGWHWTDENRRKWGWVAEKSGAVMKMQLNTRLEGSRSAEHASAPIVVQFAYLQSYTNMGTAKITCESGCECESVTIDAFDPRPVSVTAMYDHQISQSKKCVLQLKTTGKGKTVKKDTNQKYMIVADDARRGEKFKLLGVVVGEEPGAEKGTVTWLRSETHSKANLYHGGRSS